MFETLLTIEPQPYSASSVYYALNKAPESAYQSLLGLYAYTANGARLRITPTTIRP